MPKKYFETVGEEEFRKKPIGSGPWKFVRSVPGDRLEFEAVNNAHWRGRPHFKSLHILQIPEESTRVAMVRTGEAAIASISPETVLGAGRGGLEVLTVPGTMQAVFQFYGTWRPSVKDDPITKPRVRQALSLAIDRKQIIEHVMAGKAQMPRPFSTFGFTESLSVERWKKWSDEAYRYDPALAKKDPGGGRISERLRAQVRQYGAARHAVHGQHRHRHRRHVDQDRRQGDHQALRVGRLPADAEGRSAQPDGLGLDVPDRRPARCAVALQRGLRPGQHGAAARRQGELPGDLQEVRRHLQGGGQRARPCEADGAE